MSTYIQQVNPAALLGYSFPFVTLHNPGNVNAPDVEFHAGRASSSAGRMYAQMKIADQNLLRALEALPEYASLKKRSFMPSTGIPSITFESMAYSQLLALMGVMASFGVKFDTEFANQQAAVSRVGLPPGAQAAYDRFVQDATSFLNQVQLLGLSELASRRGVCAVERPLRAIGLAKGPSGVFVTPDPFDPRYVHIIIRGKIAAADVLRIRDLAYGHYEKSGIRVQMGS